MELLPCPLCGNDLVELVPTLYEGDALFVIRCDCCGVSRPPDCRENAVAFWNQRAPRPEEATKPFEILEHPIMGRFQIINRGALHD
ncbi:hypothetical protein GC087_06585 [Pantoea sp. JZ2]|uniref:Lar family restriction alleviation protein n=1 Tax=Pantoea sp. JZ2 TaxID=2654189 RepID=UPI002B4974A8|nr:Lar family restriction alleviation protein [Pantoea sp. JZ2]WRH12302.1 hypothetical protein GC087_06585 [Pantoea sp. JZ2]